MRMWLALVLQALTCHHDSLSLLEANEQAFGQQERHAFKLQLPLDRWHRLLRYLAQVVFLPPRGSWSFVNVMATNNTLLAVHLGNDDLSSSLALCAVTCRILNYSISSSPQLAPNTVIK